MKSDRITQTRALEAPEGALELSPCNRVGKGATPGACRHCEKTIGRAIMHAWTLYLLSMAALYAHRGPAPVLSFHSSATARVLARLRNGATFSFHTFRLFSTSHDVNKKIKNKTKQNCTTCLASCLVTLLSLSLHPSVCAITGIAFIVKQESPDGAPDRVSNSSVLCTRKLSVVLQNTLPRALPKSRRSRSACRTLVPLLRIVKRRLTPHYFASTSCSLRYRCALVTSATSLGIPMEASEIGCAHEVDSSLAEWNLSFLPRAPPKLSDTPPRHL